MATYVTGRMVQDQSIDSNDLTQQAAIPPGAVMSFAMSAAPVGWLPCDGAAINRTTYSALFAVIRTIHGVGNNSTTFNVPDLRGEFIRGWSAGRDVDSGRTFGSFQNHGFQDHYHGSGQTLKNTAGGGNNIAWAGGPFDIITATDGADSGNVTTETRPRNIALLYCIKF